MLTNQNVEVSIRLCLFSTNPSVEHAKFQLLDLTSVKCDAEVMCVTSLFFFYRASHISFCTIMDTLNVSLLKPSTALDEATRALGSFINLGSDQDTLDIMHELMFMKKTFSIKPTVAVFTGRNEKNLGTICEEEE
ncbi:hypothetical protein LEN26_018279 [Aphanomyces euteiches]|nr:hypothetical protein LEN26_018279 [Aphanomyces euteiches]KAH9195876.1 hypothetical protein AeNC1_002144 [Aphanomyces euteiches]